MDFVYPEYQSLLWILGNIVISPFPFKKIIKFDLICMGMGVVIGMGVGAYLVASGLFG